MKNYILVLTLLIGGLFGSSSVYAQSSNQQAKEYPIDKNGKYALLVDQVNYFKSGVMGGERLKKESSKIEYEIVLIGPVVKELAENKDLLTSVENAQKAGVKIVVCEFAMKNFGKEKSNYHSSILFTPNAFTYFWGLKDHGFRTIEL